MQHKEENPALMLFSHQRSFLRMEDKPPYDFCSDDALLRIKVRTCQVVQINTTFVWHVSLYADCKRPTIYMSRTQRITQ